MTKKADKKATTKKVAPKKEAPKKEAPKKVAPKKVAPKKEAPKKEAPKKEAPEKTAAPKVTKKSIVIEQVTKGATLDQMAKAMEKAGLGDFEVNRRTARLWLVKLDRNVKRDEKGRYTFK